MLKKKKILLVLIILLVSVSVIAAAQDVKRAPRLNFNGITGDEFIGQAGVLYPFRNTEDSTWFTDFRYRMSEDDIDEWNLGLGYRRKIDTAENHIAGIYAYKDRREEHDHYWDMWTVGGEILTDQWDFRLNTYITDNDKVLAPGSTTGGSSLEVNNDQVLVYTSGSEIYYKSMNGLDIEIGKRFTETDTIFKNVGIYAKLFRFFESDTPTMTGRQIRINKQFGDRDKITWKIGAQWRDDNIRGSETEATFAVSIPFGKGKTDDSKTDKSPSEIVESRMTEQPERDLDVVVGESVVENKGSGEEEAIENPATGEDIKVWYVTQDGEGDETGEKNNSMSIAELLGGNDKNEGDIIVLEGEFNYKASSEPEKDIFLKPYQQIISSNKDGHAIVKNPVGDETLKFKPEVEKATINLIGEELSSEGPGSEGRGFVLMNEGGDYEGNVISGIEFNFKAETVEEGKELSALVAFPDFTEGENIINNNIFSVDKNDRNNRKVSGITLIATESDEENGVEQYIDLADEYLSNNEFNDFRYDDGINFKEDSESVEGSTGINIFEPRPR